MFTTLVQLFLKLTIEFVFLYAGLTYPMIFFLKKKKNCWGCTKVVDVSYIIIK
jgi:hypothetical protein